MKVFDLHCDTIGECCNNCKSLLENDMHFDLKRASQYQSYTQVFAVWIRDEMRGKDALDYFNAVSDDFYNQISKHSNIISLNQGNTPVKGILACEGGSACGGTIEGLYELYEKGVRLITLTWNSSNEIAGGAFSDAGFTDFGKDFVRECNRLGIVVDVSHLNRKSFAELTKFYSGSFIASHSNADIVASDYAHKRNLQDFQIDVIRDREGLIGLNYYTEFLEDNKFKGVEALKRQIDYFLRKGCENVIALGSDFDGCKIGDELSGVQKLSAVYSELSREYGAAFTDKLFYSNAQNYFHRANILKL